jgi:mono/diheme cytochrome c family protein
MRGFISGVVLTVAVILGGLYQYLHLGKFPIGADNPPSAVERWLTEKAMDEYVDRNMPKQDNPMQPNAQNLAAGARLYEQNCSYCHGGLLQRVSPMRAKFNPPVPQIIDRIPGDPDAHLFWIIKHGIRLSGMPSWAGILSDDQIWQVIAFVKHSANLPAEAQEAWRQAAAPATANPAPPQTAPPTPGSQPQR